eukprot:COSAG05_NODE_645_length_8126_cov_2.992276_4_plen_157_part_00
MLLTHGTVLPHIRQCRYCMSVLPNHLDNRIRTLLLDYCTFHCSGKGWMRIRSRQSCIGNPCNLPNIDIGIHPEEQWTQRLSACKLLRSGTDLNHTRWNQSHSWCPHFPRDKHTCSHCHLKGFHRYRRDCMAVLRSSHLVLHSRNLQTLLHTCRYSK